MVKAAKFFIAVFTIQKEPTTKILMLLLNVFFVEGVQKLN